MTDACDQCEGTEDVRPIYDWHGRPYGHQCDNCAEQAWHDHQNDHGAVSSQERYEQAHKAKKETR